MGEFAVWKLLSILVIAVLILGVKRPGMGKHTGDADTTSRPQAGKGQENGRGEKR